MGLMRIQHYSHFICFFSSSLCNWNKINFYKNNRFYIVGSQFCYYFFVLLYDFCVENVIPKMQINPFGLFFIILCILQLFVSNRYINVSYLSIFKITFYTLCRTIKLKSSVKFSLIWNNFFWIFLLCKMFIHSKSNQCWCWVQLVDYQSSTHKRCIVYDILL